MEYNGREVPDEVIIERARELGYIKMPTWGVLFEWVYIQFPDHISERDVFPVASYIFDQLMKGGYDGADRANQQAAVGGGGTVNQHQGGTDVDNKVPW